MASSIAPAPVAQINVATPRGETITLLTRLLRTLAAVAGVIFMAQIFVYLGNRSLPSLIIALALMFMALAAAMALLWARRANTLRAITIMSAGMFVAAFVCVLADPRVMTVSMFAAILAVALAMPFVSAVELRGIALGASMLVAAIAICGTFIDLFDHTYTTASNASLVLACTLAGITSLNWLRVFHQRLLGLVGDLSLARDGLESTVAQRTVQLQHELARARALEVELQKELERERELEFELQLGRERLVNTLEEERRRIRRDLHDGLGPQLASLTLKLDAARHLAARPHSDGGEIGTLLAEMKSQTQGAVVDVRRLVYGLRPPVLDEMGLAGALRHHAAQMSSNTLKYLLDVHEPLPPLSAALEVAAFRIALEAMNNVQKHAHASQCMIGCTMRGLDCDGDVTHGLCVLEISISDNGIGVPPAVRSGVGMHSMRERAAELGGALEMLQLNPGTRIIATLPLTNQSQKP